MVSAVLLIVLVVAAVVIPAQAAVQNIVCNAGCDACFGYVDASLDWASSLADAQSQSFNGATGFLAEVYNSDDNDAMLQSHSGLGNAWLGANRVGGSDWAWQVAGTVFYQGQTTAGTCVTYCAWGASEPNNSPNNSPYLEVRDNHWNDRSDDSNAYMVRFNVADMTQLPDQCCSDCARVIKNAILN